MPDMKLDDWGNRWVDKRTGWHKSVTNEQLIKYFPSGAKRVFVPLCGKSVDLLW